jgi:hypothetical protein
MPIIHNPRKLYPGDAVSAKLLNDVIETAAEAYRLLSLELFKASPIDWPSLEGAFSVSADGDLMFNYEGENAPTFRLDEDGCLKLMVPLAMGEGGEDA